MPYIMRVCRGWGAELYLPAASHAAPEPEVLFILFIDSGFFFNFIIINFIYFFWGQPCTAAHQVQRGSAARGRRGKRTTEENAVYYSNATHQVQPGREASHQGHSKYQ